MNINDLWLKELLQGSDKPEKPWSRENLGNFKESKATQRKLKEMFLPVSALFIFSCFVYLEFLEFVAIWALVQNEVSALRGKHIFRENHIAFDLLPSVCQIY